MENNIIQTPVIRKALTEVIELLATVVDATYGPTGAYVGYTSNDHAPIMTKDGLNALTRINFEGELRTNLSKMLIEPSMDIAAKSGDGTSSAILFMKEVFDRTNHMDPIRSKTDRRYLSSFIDTFREEMLKSAIKVDNLDDIKDIATTSLDAEESLVKLVTEAYTGIDPAVYEDVSVFYKAGERDRVESEDGYVVENLLPVVLEPNAVGGTMELEDVSLLVTKGPIQVDDHIMFITNILKSHVTNGLNIVVVVDPIPNKTKNIFYNIIKKLNAENNAKCTVLENQAIAEIQKDLFVDFISYTGKNEYFIPETLVGADKETVTNELNVISGLISKMDMIIDNGKTLFKNRDGISTAVEYKLDYLREMLAKAKEEGDDLAVKINSRRIASLQGLVKRIYVTGSTDTVRDKRLHQIDDAVAAVRSAIKYGYTYGCHYGTIAVLDGMTVDPLYNGITKDSLVSIRDKYLPKVSITIEGDVRNNDAANPYRIMEPVETSIDVVSVGVSTVLEVLSLQIFLLETYHEKVRTVGFKKEE